MPTYQDALSAEPAEFVGYAAQMTAAAGDLGTHQGDYGEQVSRINAHWKDTANDAFNGDVAAVNAHIGQVIGGIEAAAAGLSSAGAQMAAECTALKGVDAALKATGFEVQPAPLVTLGPVQRTAIAAAGPFGAVLEAALQAQAAAGTAALQALLSMVNAADAAAGAALASAADLLKPLEDKAGGGEDRDLKHAEDHSGEAAAEEEPSEEDDAAEEEEEPAEEEAPEEQGQQDPGQDPGQQAAPQMPQTPAGLDEFAQPEVPGLDTDWEAPDLPEAEEFSGGLAAGGGLGGGAGGLGGAPSPGGLATGSGAVTPGAFAAGGPVAAPAASAAKATGAGGRNGMGAMMGGGRGAAPKDDDAAERESHLTEDPEEDVWGTGKIDDDDNPYA